MKMKLFGREKKGDNERESVCVSVYHVVYQLCGGLREILLSLILHNLLYLLKANRR